MPSYTTVQDLLRMRATETADDLQRGAQRARDRSPDGATFLSHSSKDDEHMPIVVRILENHGATVYLDKKDPTLSSSSGREVAKILRSRIKVCRKFIVFASNHIKDSRWVPWELGLSDGYKDSKNTAIFPAIDNAHETRWTEQEYLGAYDRVVWGDLQGYTQPVWMVWNQDGNTAIPLRDWLSR